MKKQISYAAFILSAALTASAVPAYAEEGIAADGTYTTSAEGKDGDVVVETTIENGVITSVVVTEQNETPEIASKPLEVIPAAIVEANAYNVDAITGATITSDAITNAVAAAITEAGGDLSAYEKGTEEEAAGFKYAQTLVWLKNHFTLGRQDYQWIHEPCLFGWKKSGKHQWYSDRKQTTVWEFEKTKKNTDHPTMKPIPLLSYPIANSSMSNTLVLDPFGGSGSTLIACEQMDRSCYTIELDEKYCDVIVKRYIELVGTDDGVSVQRDGIQYKYAELPKNCADICEN